MSCEACEKFQIGPESYWFRWKRANVEIRACAEHRAEIFEALRSAEDRNRRTRLDTSDTTGFYFVVALDFESDAMRSVWTTIHVDDPAKVRLFDLIEQAAREFNTASPDLSLSNGSSIAGPLLSEVSIVSRMSIRLILKRSFLDVIDGPKRAES